MSQGYETPRWDQDDVPELGERGPLPEEEPADAADPVDTPAPGELEDPWARAARETRIEVGGESTSEEPVDARHETDVDRSSENVLADWRPAREAPADDPVADDPDVDDAVAPEAEEVADGWVVARHELEAEAEPELELEPAPQATDDAPAAEEADAPRGDAEARAQQEAPDEPEQEELPPPELGSASAEHAPGELTVPPGVPVLEGIPRGERRSVGIVVGRFNGKVTSRLLDSALAELADLGVSTEAVTVMPVPGAFELPLAAMALAKTRRFSCIVALGCVIRGDTPHFDYVASEAASGLQLAGIETGVPIAFGVLTLDRIEQADARAEKGAEAVRTALEMADLFANLRAAAAR